MWKFFRREKEVQPPKEEIIAISDVKLWLESFENRKLHEIEGEHKELLDELKELRKEAFYRIESLESAKLRNDKIPEREKHFMKGNREGYSQRVRKFFEDLPLSTDLFMLQRDLEIFDREMESVLKSTKRQYAILQHFFANESGAVARCLKRADAIFSQLKSLNKKMMRSEIEAARKDIESIFRKNKLHEEKNKELLAIESRISDIKESRKKNEKDRDRLFADEEMLFVLDLKKQLSMVEDKIRSVEREIRESFSAIEAALKKYQRMQYDDIELSESYLNDPVAALTRDFELKIMHILGKIEVALNNDTIELKKAKKIKALIAIEDLSAEKFKNFMKDYNELCKEKHALENKIDRSPATLSLREMESNIKENHSEIKMLTIQSEELQTEIEKLATMDDVKGLENRLSSIAGVDLILKG